MRETKVEQVYPSQSAVDLSIKLNECFGWECMGQQQIQEFTGEDSDGTRHYETYVKITFSREKSSPWYSAVCELEDEYKTLGNMKKGDSFKIEDKNYLKIAKVYNLKLAKSLEETETSLKAINNGIGKPVPHKPGKFITFILLFLACAGVGIYLFFTNMMLMYIGFIPAVIFFIIAMCSIKNLKGLNKADYEKATDLFNKRNKYKQEVVEFLKERMRKLPVMSAAIIQGK